MGVSNPFRDNGAKIRELERIADKTFRHRVNDQLIGLCQCLEAGGKIRGFAEHRPFLGGVLPHEFADDDLTGRDPDSCSNTQTLDGDCLDEAPSPYPE